MGWKPLPAVRVTKKAPPPEATPEVPMFPEWLRQRHDFQIICSRNVSTDQLMRALQQPPDKRLLQDLAEIAAYIGTNRILAPLGPRVHSDLSKTVTLLEADAGATLIKQGDPGLEFFIIYRGTVRVEVNGIPLTTLTAGGSFGEKALENNEPRNANIFADTPCKLIIIKAVDYLNVMNRITMQTKRSHMQFLQEHFYFATRWQQSKLLSLASIICTTTYAQREVIFRKGTPSSLLMIVSKGSVLLKGVVREQKVNMWPAAQKGMCEVCPHTSNLAISIRKLGLGDFFGEDCLLGYTDRQYQAVAAEDDTIVFSIPVMSVKQYVTAEDIAVIRTMVGELYQPMEELKKRVDSDKMTQKMVQKLKYDSLPDKYRRTLELAAKKALEPILPDPRIKNKSREKRRKKNKNFSYLNLPPMDSSQSMASSIGSLESSITGHTSISRHTHTSQPQTVLVPSSFVLNVSTSAESFDWGNVLLSSTRHTHAIQEEHAQDIDSISNSYTKSISSRHTDRDTLPSLTKKMQTYSTLTHKGEGNVGKITRKQGRTLAVSATLESLGLEQTPSA